MLVYRFRNSGVQWFSMRLAAKLVNRNIGRNCLYALLRSEGIINNRNEPIGKFKKQEYFASYTRIHQHCQGNQRYIVGVTLVSAKGIAYIQQLLDKKQKNGYRKNKLLVM